MSSRGAGDSPPLEGREDEGRWEPGESFAGEEYGFVLVGVACEGRAGVDAVFSGRGFWTGRG